MPPQPGYYWILEDELWTIGEYTGRDWYIIGVAVGQPVCVRVLGPEILQPDNLLLLE